MARHPGTLTEERYVQLGVVMATWFDGLALLAAERAELGEPAGAVVETQLRLLRKSITLSRTLA